MNSYQQRKIDIAYYQQCVAELEATARHLAGIINKNGLAIPMRCEGIRGDSFITPYNSGEFDLTLLSEMAEG